MQYDGVYFEYSVCFCCNLKNKANKLPKYYQNLWLTLILQIEKTFGMKEISKNESWLKRLPVMIIIKLMIWIRKINIGNKGEQFIDITWFIFYRLYCQHFFETPQLNSVKIKNKQIYTFFKCLIIKSRNLKKESL